MSDDHDIHYFEGPGIEEGNAKVPTWFKWFMLGLFIFFVAYLAQYLVGAQPSSAQMR